jgi:hypothetical protein
MLWADLLTRTLVDGADLPIGMLTALVGGPFFFDVHSHGVITHKGPFGGGDGYFHLFEITRLKGIYCLGAEIHFPILRLDR